MIKNKNLKTTETNTSETPTPIKKTMDNLGGTWISQTETKNGVVHDIQGIHTLTLVKGRQYKSFYKPSNLSKGSWILINDSCFQLPINAMNDFRIMELTDTILIARLMFVKPNEVINY